MASPRTSKLAAATLARVEGKGKRGGSPRPKLSIKHSDIVSSVTQRLAPGGAAAAKYPAGHSGDAARIKFRYSAREPQGASLQQGYTVAAIRGEHAPTVAIARMDGRRQEVAKFPYAAAANHLSTQEPSRFRTKGYPENGARQKRYQDAAAANGSDSAALGADPVSQEDEWESKSDSAAPADQHNPTVTEHHPLGPGPPRMLLTPGQRAASALRKARQRQLRGGMRGVAMGGAPEGEEMGVDPRQASRRFAVAEPPKARDTKRNSESKSGAETQASAGTPSTAETAAELESRLRGALNARSFEAVQQRLQQLDPMSTETVPAEALAGTLQRLLPREGAMLSGNNVVRLARYLGVPVRGRRGRGAGAGAVPASARQRGGGGGIGGGGRVMAGDSAGAGSSQGPRVPYMALFDRLAPRKGGSANEGALRNRKGRRASVGGGVQAGENIDEIEGKSQRGGGGDGGGGGESGRKTSKQMRGQVQSARAALDLQRAALAEKKADVLARLEHELVRPKPTTAEQALLVLQQRAVNHHAVGTFRRLDTDRDGVVTREEFRSGLRHLGMELSLEEAERLVRLVDRNSDGVIQYSELCRALDDEGRDARRAAEAAARGRRVPPGARAGGNSARLEVDKQGGTALRFLQAAAHGADEVVSVLPATDRGVSAWFRQLDERDCGFVNVRDVRAYLIRRAKRCLKAGVHVDLQGTREQGGGEGAGTGAGARASSPRRAGQAVGDDESVGLPPASRAAVDAMVALLDPNYDGYVQLGDALSVSRALQGRTEAGGRGPRMGAEAHEEGGALSGVTSGYGGGVTSETAYQRVIRLAREVVARASGGGGGGGGGGAVGGTGQPDGNRGGAQPGQAYAYTQRDQAQAYYDEQLRVRMGHPKPPAYRDDRPAIHVSSEDPVVGNKVVGNTDGTAASPSQASPSGTSSNTKPAASGSSSRRAGHRPGRRLVHPSLLGAAQRAEEARDRMGHAQDLALVSGEERQRAREQGIGGDPPAREATIRAARQLVVAQGTHHGQETRQHAQRTKERADATAAAGPSQPSSSSPRAAPRHPVAPDRLAAYEHRRRAIAEQSPRVEQQGAGFLRQDPEMSAGGESCLMGHRSPRIGSGIGSYGSIYSSSGAQELVLSSVTGEKAHPERRRLGGFDPRARGAFEALEYRNQKDPLRGSPLRRPTRGGAKLQREIAVDSRHVVQPQVSPPPEAAKRGGKPPSSASAPSAPPVSHHPHVPSLRLGLVPSAVGPGEREAVMVSSARAAMESGLRTNEAERRVASARAKRGARGARLEAAEDRVVRACAEEAARRAATTELGAIARRRLREAHLAQARSHDTDEHLVGRARGRRKPPGGLFPQFTTTFRLGGAVEEGTG